MTEQQENQKTVNIEQLQQAVETLGGKEIDDSVKGEVGDLCRNVLPEMAETIDNHEALLKRFVAGEELNQDEYDEVTGIVDGDILGKLNVVEKDLGNTFTERMAGKRGVVGNVLRVMGLEGVDREEDGGQNLPEPAEPEETEKERKKREKNEEIGESFGRLADKLKAEIADEVVGDDDREEEVEQVLPETPELESEEVEESDEGAEEVEESVGEEKIPDWQVSYGRIKNLPNGSLKNKALERWFLDNMSNAEIDESVLAEVNDLLAASQVLEETVEEEPAPESEPEAIEEEEVVLSRTERMSREVERIGHQNLIGTLGVYVPGGAMPAGTEAAANVRAILLANNPDIDFAGMSGREIWEQAQEVYFRYLAGDVLMGARRAAVDSEARSRLDPEMSADLVVGLARDFGIRMEQIDDSNWPTEARDRFQEWIYEGVPLSIEGSLYENFTEQDWWDLASVEILERLQRPEISEDENWMNWGLDHPDSGVEVPAIVYMKRTEETRKLWEKEIKPFIIACRGIDRTAKLWWSSCDNTDKLLWRLGFGKDEQGPLPLKEKIDLDFSWLETVSKMRKEMGWKVGGAISKYVQNGRHARQVYEAQFNIKWYKGELKIEQERKRPNPATIAALKGQIDTAQAWVDGQEADYKNVFSGNVARITDARVGEIREEVREAGFDPDRPGEKIGELAEELAFRTLSLLGISAEYNFSGFGGDSLASLMRPNDLRWQFLRAGKIPGPPEIVGQVGIPQTQPMNGLLMLSSYPEFAGDVPTRALNEDGEVMVAPLENILADGDFEFVDWTQLPGAVAWNVWLLRINKANGFIAKLSGAGEIDIGKLMDKKELIGIKEDAKVVLMQERVKYSGTSIVWDKEKEEGTLKDGTKYQRRVPEYVDNGDDEVTQKVVYSMLMAAINENSPRFAQEGEKFGMADQIKRLVDNVGHYRILQGDWMARLKKNSHLFLTKAAAVQRGQEKFQ